MYELIYLNGFRVVERFDSEEARDERLALVRSWGFKVLYPEAEKC